MTTATAQTFEILGREFDLDQLADIANHGCVAGVSGFIYSSELCIVYNENEDHIWEYLDEQADNMGENNGFRMVINAIERKQDTWTMQEVKELAVWMYVELTALETLTEYDHPSVC